MIRPRPSEIQIVLLTVMATAAMIVLGMTELTALLVFEAANFAFFAITMFRIGGRLHEPGRFITFEGKALENLRALRARKAPAADPDATERSIEIHQIERGESR